LRAPLEQCRGYFRGADVDYPGTHVTTRVAAVCNGVNGF